MNTTTAGLFHLHLHYTDKRDAGLPPGDDDDEGNKQKRIHNHNHNLFRRYESEEEEISESEQGGTPPDDEQEKEQEREHDSPSVVDSQSSVETFMTTAETTATTATTRTIATDPDDAGTDGSELGNPALHGLSLKTIKEGDSDDDTTSDINMNMNPLKLRHDDDDGDDDGEEDVLDETKTSPHALMGSISRTSSPSSTCQSVRRKRRRGRRSLSSRSASASPDILMMSESEEDYPEEPEQVSVAKRVTYIEPATRPYLISIKRMRREHSVFVPEREGYPLKGRDENGSTGRTFQNNVTAAESPSKDRNADDTTKTPSNTSIPTSDSERRTLEKEKTESENRSAVEASSSTVSLPAHPTTPTSTPQWPPISFSRPFYNSKPPLLHPFRTLHPTARAQSNTTQYYYQRPLPSHSRSHSHSHSHSSSPSPSFSLSPYPDILNRPRYYSATTDPQNQNSTPQTNRFNRGSSTNTNTNTNTPSPLSQAPYYSSPTFSRFKSSKHNPDGFPSPASPRPCHSSTTSDTSLTTTSSTTSSTSSSSSHTRHPTSPGAYPNRPGPTALWNMQPGNGNKISSNHDYYQHQNQNQRQYSRYYHQHHHSDSDPIRSHGNHCYYWDDNAQFGSGREWWNYDRKRTNNSNSKNDAGGNFGSGSKGVGVGVGLMGFMFGKGRSQQR